MVYKISSFVKCRPAEWCTINAAFRSCKKKPHVVNVLFDIPKLNAFEKIKIMKQYFKKKKKNWAPKKVKN